MASISVTITATGITAPTYPEILAELQSRFQAIYGTDIYIAADSQDGQFLAVLAQAIYDANQEMIAAYNSFNPTYAVGVGLSTLVKINGIARLVSSSSTAVGNVVGQAGTIIVNGSVKDDDGNIWDLPNPTNIPVGGLIAVTVTAQEQGDIQAATGTINTINTPTYGWQSFVSTSDAVPGNPVESDAELRLRQTSSTSLPALTPLGSMYGALANLAGVDRLALYENPTGAPDANGLPAHSICAVMDGGDTTEIAETIGQRKTPGAATYGTTTGTYTDPVTGIAYDIDFFALAPITIKVVITGTALTGYASTTATAIKEAVAAYISGLDIGQDVDYTRIWAPSYLNGSALGETYEITALTIAEGAGAPGVIDIPIAFNEAAVCLTTDVTVTIA